jgi:hypothetical protein
MLISTGFAEMLASTPEAFLSTLGPICLFPGIPRAPPSSPIRTCDFVAMVFRRHVTRNTTPIPTLSLRGAPLRRGPFLLIERHGTTKQIVLRLYAPCLPVTFYCAIVLSEATYG